MSDAAAEGKNALWISELAAVSELLRRHGIAFFLDMGTLLGAVRDGAFIPWDNDIDLGVVARKSDDPAVARFCVAAHAQGFTVNHCDQSLALLKPGGIEINLAFYVRMADGFAYRYLQPEPRAELRHTLKCIAAGRYHGAYMRGWRGTIKRLLFRAPMAASLVLRWLDQGREPLKYKPVLVQHRFFDQTESFTFLGHTFEVPSPVAEYLASRYGDGWRTPVKAWNYATDDRAIRQEA